MYDNKKKIFGLLGIVVLLLVGWWFKTSYIDKPALITVTGEGTVKAKPETVEFTVIALNSSSSSTQAIANNNKIVHDLVNSLKSNGIKDQDLSLAYVQVVPPQASLGQTNYQAINSINVTLRTVDNLDNLITKLYSFGAQSISNIVFSTNDSRELEKQAVALAIKDTKARAKELAKASGKRLGRMVSISTGEVGKAGALGGETSQSDFGSLLSNLPSQIEVVRNASIIFELR